MIIIVAILFQNYYYSPANPTIDVAIDFYVVMVT